MTRRTQPFLSMIENGKKVANLKLVREYASWCKLPIYQIIMVAELWDDPVYSNLDDKIYRILHARMERKQIGARA